MISFKEFLKESREPKWQMPPKKDIELEYQLEYVNKNMGNQTNDAWPTVSDFVKAVGKSKIIKITPQIDSKIDYRSRTTSKDSLRSLISSYRSWPEFRNDKTLNNLYDRIGNGETMNLPMILRWNNGKMRILGGNTRADVAMQLHGSYKALIIDVGV